MRKYIFILFLLINLLAVSAQEQPSSLQIRMWDNSLFSAVFAGDESGRYQRTYNVRTLAGGEYYLKIMKRSSYGIETIFEGQIEIPPASRVQAVLMQNGALEISVLDDTQKTTNSFDFKSKIEEIQSKVKTVSTKPGEDSNRRIESLEFTDLKNNMMRAPNDSIRDSIAVDGLRKNTFTTSYVVQLTKLFKTETTRLVFAKSAYTRVVDPENYFQVRYLFAKKESLDELDKYMEEKNSSGETLSKEFQGLF